MDNRPIGVFDSGLGGLTAVKQLEQVLPGESLVYFGDTGRVPYGSRGKDTILRYARQDMDFLLAQNVKAVLAACGTVSSVARSVGEALSVPYIDVIGHSGRGSFRYDYEKLIPLFGERGKLVEINESTLKSSYSRKNCTEIAALCKKYRVPVVVDSDAHFALSIGRFPAALEMLEEIGFPQELVINADSDRFWSYLEQKGIQKNPD